jgi:hypothetical protein
MKQSLQAGSERQIRSTRAPALTLNETSIKPARYGERFVKRRGLFSLSVHRANSLFRLRKPAAQ